MAREKMVTRTVAETTVDVMVVNTNTCEVSIVQHKLTYQSDEKQALKYVQKHFDSDELKHVSIQGFRNEEVLYGMTEQEFIKHAKVLPPRKQYEIYDEEQ